MWYMSGHAILALSGERGAEEFPAAEHLAVAVTWWALCANPVLSGAKHYDVLPNGLCEGLTGACRVCSALQHAALAAVLWVVSLGAQGALVGTARGKTCLRCTPPCHCAKLSPVEAAGALKHSGRLSRSVLAQPGNASAGLAGGR